MGGKNCSGEVPSEVHTEEPDAQRRNDRAHQKSDANGNSIDECVPGRQSEPSECEDDSKAGAVSKVVGESRQRGRCCRAQSEPIEQKHTHKFGKIAGHESHAKAGIPDGFEGDGRRGAGQRAVAQ